MHFGLSDLVVAIQLHLCVEFLLITLHIHSTFHLSTGSSQLESRGAVLDRFVKIVQALLTAVLQGVLQTGGKIWHKLSNRPKYTLALLYFLAG